MRCRNLKVIRVFPDQLGRCDTSDDPGIDPSTYRSINLCHVVEGLSETGRTRLVLHEKYIENTILFYRELGVLFTRYVG